MLLDITDGPASFFVAVATDALPADEVSGNVLVAGIGAVPFCKTTGAGGL